MVANTLLVFIPGVSSGSEHSVVHKTNAAERLSKNLLLLVCWVESEFVRSLYIHVYTIALFCVKSIKFYSGGSFLPPYLPAMNDGVSRRN